MPTVREEIVNGKVVTIVGFSDEELHEFAQEEKQDRLDPSFKERDRLRGTWSERHAIPRFPSPGGSGGLEPTPDELVYRTSRDERFHLNQPSVFDMIPLPRWDSYPKNGYRYTWEDDALNLKIRETDRYEHEGGGNVAPWNSPRRCRGWSRNTFRPCRRHTASNADGISLEMVFCDVHLNPGKVKQNPGSSDVVPRQSATWRHAGGLFMPETIVAKARKQTRHGAYSAIIREQTRQALAQGRVPADRIEDVQYALEVAESVNTDDPIEALNENLRLIQTQIALLNRWREIGKVSEGDYMLGLNAMAEQARKTALAKYAIMGSANDELDRSVEQALDEIGLGPISSVDSPLKGLPEGDPYMEVLNGTASDVRGD